MNNEKDCSNCKYSDTCATNYCDAVRERGYNIRDGKDCWQPKEESMSVEETICLYWQTFFHGAAEFMKYLQDYYGREIPIYPFEMEDIFTEFLQQYGEVKAIST